jgi:hypothetical protein
MSSRAPAEFRRSGADGVYDSRERACAGREIVSAKACYKQDCERFATYDTMKATAEDEPENGLRGADTLDGLARAERHSASKAEYGETS